MTTYGVMQTRISDETQRPDLLPQIKLAILSAIEDLKAERFARINDGTFTIETAANQAWYDIPTALKSEDGSSLPSGVTLIEIDKAVVNLNNWFQPLIPVTAGWTDIYQIPTYTGQPYYFAHLGERIRFAPVPDGVYTVTIRGHVEWGPLVDDTDSNLWCTIGEKLIRSRAKAILARDVLQDAELAGLSERSEVEARMSLDRQTTARSPQRLAAWGY